MRRFDPQPLTDYRLASPDADRIPAPVMDPAEAFRALDELMVVVEALCPEWPARPPLTRTPSMKL